ncbi:MAG: TetR/AcrR family transcriptional regulator [Jiangellaceae bacterium]
MPVQVDHDARRAQLAQAVWRIVVRDGVRGASVRGVAREAGLSMGSVRHFFGTQEELLLFAVQEVVSQASRRIEAGAQARTSAVDQGRPLDAAVALLEEVLPLDEERQVEAMVWAAFTAPPVTDPSMAAIRRQVDDDIRQLCRDTLTGLAELGLLHPARDVAVEVERVHALLDGLTMHMLLDPAQTPADRVRPVLLTHVGDLGTPPNRYLWPSRNIEAPGGVPPVTGLRASRMPGTGRGRTS